MFGTQTGAQLPMTGLTNVLYVRVRVFLSKPHDSLLTAFTIGTRLLMLLTADAGPRPSAAWLLLPNVFTKEHGHCAQFQNLHG
jgi:hypothetical protein